MFFIKTTASNSCFKLIGMVNDIFTMNFPVFKDYATILCREPTQVIGYSLSIIIR